jgi:hypothetical protein
MEIQTGFMWCRRGSVGASGNMLVNLAFHKIMNYLDKIQSAFQETFTAVELNGCF